MLFDGSSLTLPASGAPWVTSGWSSHSRLGIVSDAASKYGSVIEKRALVGDGPGWGGSLAQTGNGWAGGAGLRDVYIRIVWKPSSNYQTHPAGEKLIYFGRKFQGQAPRSFTIGRRGNRIKIVNDGGELPGGTVSGTGRGGTFLSEGAASIVNGQYQTLQVWLRVNTRHNSDGFVKVKLNNIEVATWEHIHSSVPNDTGVVLSSGVKWKNQLFFDTPNAVGGHSGPNAGLNGWQMVQFWGGQGSTKQVNDNNRFSELYFSGK